MGNEELTTLVVGYGDVNTATTDFNDLADVHRDHRVGDYDAAIIRRDDHGPTIVESTIDERMKHTVRGAGLGLVLGLVFTPALAASVLGAGLGAAVGRITDRVQALKHSDLAEVKRLTGDSPASLIVIAENEVIGEITNAALARERRIILALEPGDVRLLKLELQREDEPPIVHT